MALAGLPFWLASFLLVMLRIGPAIAFATPFTLVQVPRSVRLLLVLGLAAGVASWLPEGSRIHDLSAAPLVSAGLRELALGSLFVLAYQLAFAGLYFAGRTIDIQAGFGLALLIDPATRTQTPLIGTLFVYAATALFFGADGHLALMRLIGMTFDLVPLGSWSASHLEVVLPTFVSTVFALALGFGGLAMLGLFLIDMSIALLARTVPQMNVLVLGFQVKTIALLLILPIMFGYGGALLVRLLASVLQALPSLI